jgi:hypothetical protein
LLLTYSTTVSNFRKEEADGRVKEAQEKSGDEVRKAEVELSMIIVHSESSCIRYEKAIILYP